MKCEILDKFNYLIYILQRFVSDLHDEREVSNIEMDQIAYIQIMHEVLSKIVYDKRIIIKFMLNAICEQEARGRSSELN